MTRTTALVLAGALLLLPLATPAAHADHTGWSLGAGFRIGNAFFTLAFGAHGHYAPGYYYRTTERLDYPSHYCTDRCFRDGRTYYHAASCPVVAAHLSHYRVVPGFLFDRFAPAPVWSGRYYRDVTPWRSGRYDRYDRYNRYDRYDHRYDRRSDRYDRRSERRHDRYDRRDDRFERRHDRYDRRDDRFERRHDRYDRRDRRDDRWRDRRDDRDSRRGRPHDSRHHSPGHGHHR